MTTTTTTLLAGSDTLSAGVGEAFQNAASSGPLLLALGACVLAGLVSFASPCVVPLVPGYLSYLAGRRRCRRPRDHRGRGRGPGRSPGAVA